MNIIYLDSLFFINCIADYFALLCAGKISGAVLNRIKIGIAAISGGLYACGCTLPELQWLAHPAVKLAFAGFLCLISFSNEQKLFRCCITFLAVSAAFGGMLAALSWSDGAVIYLPMDFKVLLLTFAVVYFALSTLFRRYEKTRCREFHRATIVFLGNEVQFNILKDTGNELYDPISNASVLVCQQNVIAPLFPETVPPHRHIDPYALFQTLASMDTYAGRMRLIPFQAVGGNGVLLGFKPDRILIDGKPQDLIVAMTDTTFSHDNTYQGIF